MTTTNARRRISTRALLIILSMVALCTWGGLLLFTRYVPPRGVLALVVFFALLETALICTLTPLTYLVTRAILVKRSYRPTSAQAIRQAVLISTWVAFNLLLRVLHSWSIFTAAVSFAIIVVVEILVLGRI